MVSNLHDVIGAPTPGVSGVSPRPVPHASHFGNVLRFMAPLTIDEILLDAGLGIYERTIKSA